MNIDNLSRAERYLIIVALQALWRERTSAYNTACTACSLSGKEWPSQDIFGIDEVASALEQAGAAPVR